MQTYRSDLTHIQNKEFQAILVMTNLYNIVHTNKKPAGEDAKEFFDACNIITKKNIIFGTSNI